MSPHSVLVVDDAFDSLTLLSGLLKQHYRVQVSNSGAKALAMACGAAPPDLILLDVVMPQLSGHEVCRLLKQDPATRHIPIIFLTALSSPEEETKGLALGAAGFIVKPVDPAVVLDMVAAQLKIKPDPARARAAMPAPGVLPALPGLDIQSGMHATMDDPQLYLRLLIRFRTVYHDFASRFAAARAANAAMQAAHTLKGSAATIGAHAVQGAAHALELACLAGADDDTVNSLLTATLSELATVMVGLQELERYTLV